MFDRVSNVLLIKTLTLTIFYPIFSFDPPANIRNLWFFDVFRGIKKEHWEEKDQHLFIGNFQNIYSFYITV